MRQGQFRRPPASPACRRLVSVAAARGNQPHRRAGGSSPWQQRGGISLKTIDTTNFDKKKPITSTRLRSVPPLPGAFAPPPRRLLHPNLVVGLFKGSRWRESSWRLRCGVVVGEEHPDDEVWETRGWAARVEAEVDAPPSQERRFAPRRFQPRRIIDCARSCSSGS
jgi:hypothetical protein